MSQRTRATHYLMMLAAGLLYAISLKYFVLPSKVILTGTEGIASALSYYFESYNLFITLYTIFHLVLIGFSLKKINRPFATRSLVVVISVAIWLLVLPTLKFAQPEPQNERIILVLFGGLLTGAAKSIAFRNRGSTGDEDIIGAFVSSKTGRSVGSIGIIAAVISTTFGIALSLLKTGAVEPAVNTLMYTCIYIFVSTETLNNFYHKFRVSVLSVITAAPGAIGNCINRTLPHRTYTTERVTGGYSGNEFYAVKTIVTREELPDLVQAVEEADNHALYYHHEVDGVSSNYQITPIE
jgi:uncharacterized membrane-anchored protein YitT (DUF2179 family)